MFILFRCQVCLLSFAAFSCMTLRDQRSVLVVQPSIDCASQEYQVTLGM
jgi:hypothetical protein